MGNEQVGDKFGRENFYHTPLYFLGFELWESIINLKIRLKKLKIASENRDIFVLVTEPQSLVTFSQSKKDVECIAYQGCGLRA